MTNQRLIEAAHAANEAERLAKSSPSQQAFHAAKYLNLLELARKANNVKA